MNLFTGKTNVNRGTKIALKTTDLRRVHEIEKSFAVRMS